MVNSNELQQAEMPLDTLYMFNYVTQGTSRDIELDYDMLSEIELNFDD